MIAFFEQNGRRYARFARLGREAGLVHAFSTRPDDVSMRLDARAAERQARREHMAADLGVDAARLCCCVQVHAPGIAAVAESPVGGRLEGIDAAITAERGLPLMTFSADCPLVLLYDPVRRVLGMAHTSWRCTVSRLAARLVERMQAECGVRPGDLLAGIGPSAGPTAYEVREDVYEAAVGLAQRERLFLRQGERMCFDLWESNRLQLVEAGLGADRIEVAGICTMTRTDLFYSFRREGPGCGHFGLMAALAHAAG